MTTPDDLVDETDDPVPSGAVAVGTMGDDPVGDGSGDPTADGGAERGGFADDLVLIDDPAHSGRRMTNIVSWVVVGIACAVVAATMHPVWIFQNTTATGGDMAPTSGARPSSVTSCSRTSGSRAGHRTGTPGSPRTCSTWWSPR